MINQDNLSIYHITDRILYLAGDITTESAADINSKLLASYFNIASQAGALRGYEVGHINLFIQSNGGSIDDMWSIINIMRQSQIPIYTYANGLVASAALKIFLAGDARIVFPHSTLMYHELSSGNNGKLQEMSEYHEYIGEKQKEIEDYVKTRTFGKMSKKMLKEIREKKKDFYMNADQAIEYGFATHKFDATSWGFILND